MEENVMKSSTSFCFVSKRANVPLRLLRQETVTRIGYNIDRLNLTTPTTHDLCILSGENSKDLTHSHDKSAEDCPVLGISEFCIRLCDCLGLFPSSYATFLGIDDSLIIIQLCMAEKRKQKCGIFDVDVSDVLLAEAQLTAMRLTTYGATGISVDDRSYYEDLLTDYENYLQHIGAVDHFYVYRQLKAYFSGGGDDTKDDGIRSAFSNLNLLLLEVPQLAIEKLMLKLLVDGKSVEMVEWTESENSRIAFDFHCTTLDKVFADNSLTPDVACTPSQHDQKLAHMERVIVSHLRLLTNTRDEIALASSLCNMAKVFTHEAFSELKRMAKAVGLPMYQVSLSLVRKIKLGGKGYALDSASPILPFLPDIVAFNGLMNRMQIAVEEENDFRNSVKRIIKIIREHAKKSCDQKLKDSWDTVASGIENAVLDQTSNACWHGFCLTSARSKLKTATMVGQQTLTIIRHFVNKYGTKSCFRHQADVLAESYSRESNKASPVRFSSLLSQFRSPETVSEDNDVPEPQIDLFMESKVEIKNKLCDISNTQVSFSQTGVHSSVAFCQIDESGVTSDTCCSLVGTPFKVKKNSLVQRSIDGVEVKKPKKPLVQGKENVPVSSKPLTKRTLDLTDQNHKQTAKKANVDVGFMKSVGESSGAAKGSGSRKKRSLGIIKGQQLMTKFFRV